METLLVPLALFLIGYVVNVFYVSVLYHRGLTHGALRFPPWVQKFAGATGPWVTGIDPKSWVCMHRLHHVYSDTPTDPHSPVHLGVMGVGMGQLRSYEAVIRGLIKGREPYVSTVKDLPFDVSWLNRTKRWWLPYILHLALGVAVGFAFSQPLAGIAYFLGMMTHPVQGWMVNALGHRFGYRNFDTDDNSRNNSLVAWLVVGEGYQNNHHANPKAANFAARRGEVDLGYLVFCKLVVALGLARYGDSPVKA